MIVNNRPYIVIVSLIVVCFGVSGCIIKQEVSPASSTSDTTAGETRSEPTPAESAAQADTVPPSHAKDASSLQVKKDGSTKPSDSGSGTKSSLKIKKASSPAEYCAENGGQFKTETANKREFNVCVFDDGTRCEESRLAKGGCVKGQCTDTLGLCKQPEVEPKDSVESACWDGEGHIRQVDDNGTKYKVCVYKDGSRCELDRLNNNQCKPGDCKESTGICN